MEGEKGDSVELYDKRTSYRTPNPIFLNMQPIWCVSMSRTLFDYRRIWNIWLTLISVARSVARRLGTGRRIVKSGLNDGVSEDHAHWSQ